MNATLHTVEAVMTEQRRQLEHAERFAWKQCEQERQTKMRFRMRLAAALVALADRLAPRLSGSSTPVVAAPVAQATPQ